jgi:hypothetical protein
MTLTLAHLAAIRPTGGSTLVAIEGLNEIPQLQPLAKRSYRARALAWRVQA